MRPNFGAEWAGSDTRCLRFARWVAPPDARLASGCWPDSAGWALCPTGFLRKVSSMLLTSLSPFPRLTLAQARFGPPDEWHLVFVNAFRHLAFEFGAWLCQPAVVIGPTLLHARLVTVGAVGDPMGGDGIEQVVVQAQAACGVTGRVKLQQRPKRFQGLHGALEADGP